MVTIIFPIRPALCVLAVVKRQILPDRHSEWPVICAAKALVTQLRGIPLKFNALQFPAGRKRQRLQFLDALWHRHRLQREHLIKRLAADLLHTLPDPQIPQFPAIRKSAGTDSGNAVGDIDINDALHILTMARVSHQVSLPASHRVHGVPWQNPTSPPPPPRAESCR